MLPLQARAMAIAPFAAISLDRFKDIGKSARKLYDRIYYGEVLPPVGAAEMSYARLLEHLENKTVKRIVLLADSRYALVEVSHAVMLCSGGRFRGGLSLAGWLPISSAGVLADAKEHQS